MKKHFLRISYLVLMFVFSSFDLTFFDAVTVGNSNEQAALDSNAAYLYVPNAGDNTLSVIDVQDPTTASIVATITGLTTPSSVVIDSSDEFIYIVNRQASGFLSKYNIEDPLNPVFVTNISVENFPDPPIFDSNDEFLYVPNVGSFSISKIQLSNNAVTNITVGNNPRTPAIDSTNSFLYVPNNSATTVTKIDLSDNSTSTISVVGNPETPVIDSNDTFMYVPTSFPSDLLRVDLSDDSTTSITVGSTPQTPVIDPNNAYMYVSNRGDMNLSVVRLSDLTVFGPFDSLGENPETPLLDFANNLLFVPNQGSFIVGVLDVTNPENAITRSGLVTIGDPATPLKNNDSSVIFVSGQGFPGAVNIFGATGDQPITPISNIRGFKKIIPLYNNRINIVEWGPPSTQGSVYHIYRNDELLTGVNQNALRFEDQGRPMDAIDTYTLQGFNEDGASTDIVSVTIP